MLKWQLLQDCATFESTLSVENTVITVNCVMTNIARSCNIWGYTFWQSKKWKDMMRMMMRPCSSTLTGWHWWMERDRGVKWWGWMRTGVLLHRVREELLITKNWTVFTASKAYRSLTGFIDTFSDITTFSLICLRSHWIVVLDLLLIFQAKCHVSDNVPWDCCIVIEAVDGEKVS